MGCNLTPGAPVFRKAHTQKFRLASGELHIPSLFSVLYSARVDHIFVRGGWEVVKTDIPECPLWHCCPLLPCSHTLQMMTDLAVLSAQRGEKSKASQCWYHTLRYLIL